MITILIILLIIDSILLMAVVLMQSSKGNGLAGPIGGSSVTMAFGVRRTSDLLTKATSVLATVLIVGCVAVNLMVGNKGTVDESIIQKNAGQQQQMPPPNTIPPTENTIPPTENTIPPTENTIPPTENTTPPAGDQNQNQQQTPNTDQKEQNKEPVNVEPQGP